MDNLRGALMKFKKPSSIELACGKKFFIKKLLSDSGRFGDVFLVCDTSGRSWAMKRMALNDQTVFQYFEHEVEIMTSLGWHHNLVGLEASGVVSGRNCQEGVLVLEYCSGGTLLDQSVRREHVWRELDLLRVLRDICYGLIRMHTHDPPIIHRDLKIENILLHGIGTYKISDFGSAIAEIVRPATALQALAADIERNTTPLYRSPEMVDIYRGHPIGPKCDIWALGCLLYKLAFQKDAFQGTLQILGGVFQFPTSHHYSKHFLDLIGSCLELDPSLRPDADALLGRIDAVIGEHAAATGSPAALPCSRSLPVEEAISSDTAGEVSPSSAKEDWNPFGELPAAGTGEESAVEEPPPAACAVSAAAAAADTAAATAGDSVATVLDLDEVKSTPVVSNASSGSSEIPASASPQPAVVSGWTDHRLHPEDRDRMVPSGASSVSPPPGIFHAPILQPQLGSARAVDTVHSDLSGWNPAMASGPDVPTSSPSPIQSPTLPQAVAESPLRPRAVTGGGGDDRPHRQTSLWNIIHNKLSPKHPIIVGSTKLHNAVLTDDLLSVRERLTHRKAKSEVTTVDNSEQTPLALAVRRGNSRVLEELLHFLHSVKGNINFQDPRGYTVLHHAAYSAEEDLLTLLLDFKGVDVTLRNVDGNTALHYFCRKCHIDYCQKVFAKFLELGAKVNAPNAFGETPLHMATFNSSASTLLIDLIIEAGGNVNVYNRNGESPLHFAVRLRKIDAVRALVRLEADVTAKTNSGLNAYELALEEGDRTDNKLVVDFLEKTMELRNWLQSVDPELFLWYISKLVKHELFLDVLPDATRSTLHSIGVEDPLHLELLINEAKKLIGSRDLGSLTGIERSSSLASPSSSSRGFWPSRVSTAIIHALGVQKTSSTHIPVFSGELVLLESRKYSRQREIPCFVIVSVPLKQEDMPLVVVWANRKEYLRMTGTFVAYVDEKDTNQFWVKCTKEGEKVVRNDLKFRCLSPEHRRAWTKAMASSSTRPQSSPHALQRDEGDPRLAVCLGDLVSVLRCSGDLWLCLLDNRVGLVPSSMLEVVYSDARSDIPMAVRALVVVTNEGSEDSAADSPTLNAVLGNEGLRKDFSRFLESEFAVENLQFLLDVQKFSSSPLLPQEMKCEAERIWLSYFSSASDSEINVSADVKSRLQALLLNKEASPALCPTMFEEVRHEIFRLLEGGLFQGWLEQGSWQKYNWTDTTIRESHQLQEQQSPNDGPREFSRSSLAARRRNQGSPKTILVRSKFEDKVKVLRISRKAKVVDLHTAVVRQLYQLEPPENYCLVHVKSKALVSDEDLQELAVQETSEELLLQLQVVPIGMMVLVSIQYHWMPQPRKVKELSSMACTASVADVNRLASRDSGRSVMVMQFSGDGAVNNECLSPDSTLRSYMGKEDGVLTFLGVDESKVVPVSLHFRDSYPSLSLYLYEDVTFAAILSKGAAYREWDTSECELLGLDEEDITDGEKMPQLIVHWKNHSCQVELVNGILAENVLLKAAKLLQFNPAAYHLYHYRHKLLIPPSTVFSDNDASTELGTCDRVSVVEIEVSGEKEFWSPFQNSVTSLEVLSVMKMMDSYFLVDSWGIEMLSDRSLDRGKYRVVKSSDEKYLGVVIRYENEMQETENIWRGKISKDTRVDDAIPRLCSDLGLPVSNVIGLRCGNDLIGAERKFGELSSTNELTLF